MLVYQRVTFFFGFGTRPCGAKSVSFGEAVQSARHSREWTSRIAWYVQCIVDSTYFLSEINIWVDQILRNNNYTKSHIKKKLLWKVQQTFHLCWSGFWVNTGFHRAHIFHHRCAPSAPRQSDGCRECRWLRGGLPLFHPVPLFPVNDDRADGVKEQHVKNISGW